MVRSRVELLTALAELTGILYKSLDEKKIAVCTFIDIEGAFDNTSHEAVRRDLERRGVDGTASTWMGSTTIYQDGRNKSWRGHH